MKQNTKRVVSSTIRLTVIPALTCLLNAACGDGTTVPEGVQVMQPLAGYGSTQWGGPVLYWDENNYDVPVCYLHNANNSGSEASYFATFVNDLQPVEDEAGLNISWDGPCSSVASEDLPKYITVVFDETANSGLAAPGFMNRRSDGPIAGSYQILVPPASTGTARHEFLHALGFLHEQRRLDSQANCPAALVPSGNNDPAPGADLLTPYDPQSIMNYCRTQAGPDLTAFDRLGLRIVYPKSFSRKVRGTLAFQTAEGLVTRTEGELTTDWTGDGALDQVIADLSWLLLSPGGTTTVGTGVRLALSGFQSGTLTFGGSMTDWLGREHTVAFTPVVSDNAKHTALVTAIL